MRRNATPAVNPQMYRHFAVVTVAITALLAFFANGESHQAVAAANASEQREMPQPAAPKSRLEVHPDTNLGSWADDEGEVMGQPTIGAYAPSSAPPPERAEGYEEQTGQAAVAPTASQIAAATAASRLRSGARGAD